MIKVILIVLGVLVVTVFAALYGCVFELIRHSESATYAKTLTRDQIQGALDMAFMFLPVIAIIYFLFVAITKKERRKKALWTLACLIPLPIAWLVNLFLVLECRLYVYEQAIEKGKPLIAAIKSYEKKNGKAPASLKDLVPSFIKAIPKSGMGAFPDFEYRTVEKVKKLPAPWEVRVDLSSKEKSQFIYYWPKQTDPNFKEGAKYGKWEVMSEFPVVDNWHFVQWLNTEEAAKESDSSFF